MPQDKELEIRLQFLEEATEYLNAIESEMLELSATSNVDRQRADVVLRAAHSIKGGAAMMGFETLSHLAHRLEDSFKVLKTAISVDAALESWLLAAVDCLRQVIALNRQEVASNPPFIVDEQWLEIHVNPVFEQLHQQLGDPTEDTATLNQSEDGQDMVAEIFETEVEGCLQRLESVLADPNQPCMLEEFSIVAQELGGLGEMLQIAAFTSLCESIHHHLETTPERVEEVAHLALQAWRRSQAALLVGQVDTLPTQIDLSVPETEVTVAVDEAAVELVDLSLPADVADLAVGLRDSSVTNIALQSELKSDAATDFKEQQENTVRVPIKQLDQLNDLFGELTIERNGIDIHLERLRNLVRILEHRVRTLQQLDTRIQTAHAKVEGSGEQRERGDAETRGHGENEVLQLKTPHKGAYPKGTQQQNSKLKTLQDPTPRSNDLNLLFQELMETVVRIHEVTGDIDLSLEDTDRTASELTRTAKQLQTTITHLRMRPLSDLVGRFPRTLRELSLQYGKNVELKVHGGSTLIDRAILEALGDPLMHLLRNAFDHGIEESSLRQARGKPEQGVIEISAMTRGNQTTIAISDDGGGINLDKIRVQAQNLGLDADAIAVANDEELLTLIFEPGFSTAKTVTTLSGRGVGLDVVRTNLRQIRGDIKVATQLGVGTTFTLSVPLTLSVARVLLVESNGMLLAFPTDALVEMLLLNPEQTLTVAGKEVINWEGTMAPLIRLDRWIKFRCPQVTVESETMPTVSVPTVLMIAQGSDLVGLQVARCWGEHEVAIRQVEGNIVMPPGLTGCTILGDGRVVPLVNAPDLLHWIASCEQSDGLEKEDKPAVPIVFQSQKDTILVVDDSINVRRFLSLTLEKAGYRVEQAKDGQDALEKLLNGLPVQAVICDIDMPRLDGYGLLARVKSNPAFKQLPVAMLTSRSGDKDRQLAMNLGATAYFSKPYNEQDLIKSLKQLL